MPEFDLSRLPTSIEETDSHAGVDDVRWFMQDDIYSYLMGPFIVGAFTYLGIPTEVRVRISKELLIDVPDIVVQQLTNEILSCIAGIEASPDI